MDFIHIDDNIDDHIHNVDDDDSEQVEDIGFIENNKLYNSRFHDDTQRQNIQNKRVYPSAQKILPGNSFTDDNKKVSKKVTYDDILSSLNMKVINGKLQIVRGDAEVVPPQQKKQVINNRQKFNENVNMNAYSKQNEFYNKFLQAQKQSQAQAPFVVESLTPEEKKRLLMIQYIKHQQERQHISRVKSRKMNFV
uniref:Uncharacterized protein n=1 Tax=viral metagenome TaxID=1070528 RepID=A0A6C0CUB1_9ZZZZ